MKTAEKPRDLERFVGRDEFFVDLPFVKAAKKDGSLELRGYASTWVQDRDQEFVLPMAFDESLEEYLQKNPIVLWQHNPDWPLGQVAEAETDDHGLSVVAYVRKPASGEAEWKVSAYNDIAAGVVRTFSIGGFFDRDILGGKLVIVKVELFEISVVSIPSNPDSIFEAARKSLKGETNKRSPEELPGKVVEQMAQVIGAKDITDPELSYLNEAGIEARYEDLAKIYRKHRRLPPPIDAWKDVSARVRDASTDEERSDLLPEVRSVLDQLRGQVDEKTGRVLSRKNEMKLREAVERLNDASTAISEVLRQLPEEVVDAEDE